VHVTEGNRFVHPVPWGHTAFAYLYDGTAKFGDDRARADSLRLVVFGDGDSVTVRPVGDPASFLLVSGKPIGEPIARYGPFVMNTRQEIAETLEELHSGRFAELASER
jgi:redox-sensitive bicupin YhaK (pirin superfamily)